MKQGLEYHQKALNHFYHLNHKEVETIVKYVEQRKDYFTNIITLEGGNDLKIGLGRGTLPTTELAEHILKACCYYFNVSVPMVKSSSRKTEYAITRKHFSRLCVREYRFTLSSTGRILGNRDHSTISVAIKDIEDKMDVYPSVREEHEDLFAFVQKYLKQLPERNGTDNIQQESC